MSSEKEDTCGSGVRESIKEGLEFEMSLKGQIRCRMESSRRAFHLEGDIKTGIDMLN